MSTASEPTGACAIWTDEQRRPARNEPAEQHRREDGAPSGACEASIERCAEGSEASQRNTALYTVDIADHVRTGHTDGLAAGLARILGDLSAVDLLAAAPGRFAAVPAAWVGDGAAVVDHSMAAAEGIAVLDLRHGHERGHRPPEARTVDIGLRLGAVRVGLTRRLLDRAVEHLSGREGGGEPLIRKQLNQGAVADVLAALELLRRYLETAVLDPSAEAVADVHAQLGDLDWEVTTLFGASGYLTDHEVRALYVAGLVANTWVTEGDLP